jgi:hypothetical protein
MSSYRQILTLLTINCGSSSLKFSLYRLFDQQGALLPEWAALAPSGELALGGYRRKSPHGSFG